MHIWIFMLPHHDWLIALFPCENSRQYFFQLPLSLPTSLIIDLWGDFNQLHWLRQFFLWFLYLYIYLYILHLKFYLYSMLHFTFFCDCVLGMIHHPSCLWHPCEGKCPTHRYTSALLPYVWHRTHMHCPLCIMLCAFHSCEFKKVKKTSPQASRSSCHSNIKICHLAKPPKPSMPDYAYSSSWHPTGWRPAFSERLAFTLIARQHIKLPRVIRSSSDKTRQGSNIIISSVFIVIIITTTMLRSK